jgi:protein-S-isoprenylcysteine O-methyltransferase Ste14
LRFGDRGEWLVVAQFVLLLLVIAAPAQIRAWPPLVPEGALLRGLVLTFVALGSVLLIAGTRQLGPNLTPLPFPKPGGTFVQNGIYGYVRHPIYGGLALVAVGWALRRGGGLVLVHAVLLCAVLEVKSRVEERWLDQRYAGYAAYRRRTRRFIPLVY